MGSQRFCLNYGRFYLNYEKRVFIVSSVSFIGLGAMTRAIAARAVQGGNAVELTGRDAAKAKDLAAALGGATTGTFGTAPAGDIVILAMPYASAAPAVSQYGDALAGRVIIDISNPFDPARAGLLTPDGSSAAQQTAKAPPRARTSSRRSAPSSATSWPRIRPGAARWTCSSPVTTPRPPPPVSVLWRGHQLACG